MDPIGQSQKRRNNGINKRIYNRINDCLRRGLYFDDVVSIRRARVPIIKCRHLESGMRIDINCSCPNSVVNTSFLRDLMFFDVRLHSFMRFMKIWAKHMWIVGRNRMTSYCFCVLVLFYLQQPYNHESPIVPSVENLQRYVPPKFVQGVNYAFELYGKMKPLTTILTSSMLIKGFFQFYRNFDFSKQIIAPYLGVTVPLEDFVSGKYKYTAYLNQLKSMAAAYHRNDDVEELNVQRVMVVQDPFQLNKNVSRGVVNTQLEYFRKCVEYGYHICMDTGSRADGKLYETLLYDIIGNIENEARHLRTCFGHNATLVQPHEMMYTFTPCRAEMRALTAHQLNSSGIKDANVKNTDSIYRMWARHYIESIYVILTHIYYFDVKLLSENDDPFDERLLQHHSKDLMEMSYNRNNIIESLKQFDDKNEVTWIINGSVDTWSDRSFRRESTQTFISLQYAQTKKFLEERQGKSTHSVNLLGRFSLKPLENCKMLEIVLKQHQQTRQWFCRKEPMRRFFTNFKCSLQNFNLKEKLHAERYGMPGKAESFLWYESTCPDVSKEQQELKGISVDRK